MALQWYFRPRNGYPDLKGSISILQIYLYSIHTTNFSVLELSYTLGKCDGSIVHVSLRVLGGSPTHQHLYYVGVSTLKILVTISVHEIFYAKNFHTKYVSRENFLMYTIEDVHKRKCVSKFPIQH